MAERRQRRTTTIREETVARFRERAASYADGNPAYQRLAEITLARAAQIERGAGPVTVQGWEFPDGVLEPDDNPSSPFVLHPDDRVTACQPRPA